MTQQIGFFKCDDYPPTDDEDDLVIEDHKLSWALSELSLPNSEVNTLEERAEFQHERDPQDKNCLLDQTVFLQVLVAK